MSILHRTARLSLAMLLGSACNDALSPDEERPERRGTDEAAIDAHAGVVRISPQAIARMGIEVATVDAVSAVGAIEVPAEIHADPDLQAHVSPMVSGQIAQVHVSIGDRVEAGQTIAVVRSVALGEARAQAARARANVDVAEANFRRQEELRKEGIGAERQYLEAQAELRRAQAEQSAAERALEVYGRGGRGSEVTIKSPISGQVVSRHATVGEVVSPADVMFEITDISRVRAVGRVYQRNAGRVREGASAVLTVQAHPGRSFSGELDYVAPSLDESTRTLPVHVVLHNADGALRPGLFGTLSIQPQEGNTQSVPAVATPAVQRLGEQTVVFVPTDDQGTFRAVPVTVSSRAGDRVRLEQGLKPGDTYVSEGAFVLKSELRRSELGEGHGDEP